MTTVRMNSAVSKDMKHVLKVGTFSLSEGDSYTIDCTSVPNYANLTVDNFILETASISYNFISASGTFTDSGVITPATNYDATTGKFTISNYHKTYYKTNYYTYQATIKNVCLYVMY